MGADLSSQSCFPDHRKDERMVRLTSFFERTMYLQEFIPFYYFLSGQA